jgi:hypothetical protein
MTFNNEMKALDASADEGHRWKATNTSRLFISPCHPDWLWCPTNLLYNGYQGLFPQEVKQPGRAADQPLTSTSAKVKKM